MDHHSALPRSVNKQFLFEEEVQNVRDVVLNLKDKWFDIKHTMLASTPTHTVGVNPYEHFAHFLGPSLYSMSGSNEYTDRYRKLAKEYNIILNNIFSKIYERIRLAIEIELKVPCVYKENTSLPGFHIFGHGLNAKPVQYNYFYTHQDSFPSNGLQMEGLASIYSFIIPIQNPKSGAKLEYLLDGQYKPYRYNEGELSYWEGTLPHRIGYFELDGEDDYRITWQIHVAVQQGKGYIFW